MNQWSEVSLDKCTGMRMEVQQKLHDSEVVMKVDFRLDKYNPVTVTVHKDMVNSIDQLSEIQRKILFLCFIACPEFFEVENE